MQSIAFFNNKGGVGKTTLLCNIAAYLALHKQKKVLVVDADPQCNATQIMLDETILNQIYSNSRSFTINSIVHPLSVGKGYSDEFHPLKISNYGVSLVPGDPKLALKEDLLSKDWQDATAGEIRGIRTSFLFVQFLERCQEYDYVLFDMGPSLGSINRAVLLACDFYLSPMSIDIFSLKAIENIAAALNSWKSKLDSGLAHIPLEDREEMPDYKSFHLKFAGYVAQQYIQKTTEGTKRPVGAYESILKKIPLAVKKHLQASDKVDYEIGTIPNLYSLIPLSQTAHKPVFALKAKDGVRGAHFNKVQEAENIFNIVTDRLLKNIETLSK